jgi:hypothetical protein
MLLAFAPSWKALLTPSLCVLLDVAFTLIIALRHARFGLVSRTLSESIINQTDKQNSHPL